MYEYPSRFLRPSFVALSTAAVAVLLAGSAYAAPKAAADKPCTLSASAIYDKVSPAVVSIHAMAINPFEQNQRIEHVSGSGVLIDPAGLVLTNSHVVFGRQILNVTLDDGSTLPARLIGADPVFDLALLRIPVPPSGTLPSVSITDSDAARVGDDVYAIGNPLGLEQTMTRGIVSSINRLLPNVPFAITEPLIQTDAPINPGSSGGPLVDSCGRVIGITSAMLTAAENIGFAIPANLVTSVVPKLLADGRVIRPWLGVQGQLVPQELRSMLRIPLADGVLVEVVEPGSPAESAGLHGGALQLTLAGQEFLLGGDIITAINGRSVATPADFAEALSALTVGSNVTLDVFRDGKAMRVTCTLPERPVLPGDVRTGTGATADKSEPRSNARRAF